MGFPFDVASWSVVEGAMFIGWGGAMPSLYSTLGLIACAVIIVLGNRSEQRQYDKHQ